MTLINLIFLFIRFKVSMNYNKFSGLRHSHTAQFIQIRSSYLIRSKTPADQFLGSNIIQELSASANDKFATINRKLDELESLFIKRSKPTFDNNSLELTDHFIRVLSNDITSRITVLRNEIKTQISSTEKDEAKLIFNLQQSQQLKLSHCVQRFRGLQCNKKYDIKEEISKDDVIEAMYSDFDPQLSTDQVALLHHNQEEIRQRNEELVSLLTKMNEINDLFRDITLIVFEQGTLLDRIDTQLDIAVNTVRSGNKDLVKAAGHQNNKCYYIYISIVVFIIIICLIIIVFRR